jgi:periplasmic protein CpxP/Spy
MSLLRNCSVFCLLLSVIAIDPVRASYRMAQGGNVNGEFKLPTKQMGQLTKDLNLTKDQIQRIQKVRKESQLKLKERRQAFQTAKQELSQLIASNATSDRVRQQRKQVQSLRQEVEDLRFENSLAIRDILTPEQRVKLQQLMQTRSRDSGKLK